MIKLKNILKEIAQGDCYEAAGKLITGAFMFSQKSMPKGAEMVHGMVDGQGALQGKRYGHAWVETDDTVYDYANGRKLEIPKAVYYGIGNIRKEDNKHYSPDEARKWIMKTKHWGPWEMSGDVVSVYEDIPAKDSDIGKGGAKLSQKDLDQIGSLNETVTQNQLDDVEAYLDKLFAAVGIDIEFTQHFMDRVNDIRNRKPIEPEEIEDLFAKAYEDRGEEIKNLGANAEAVITDMQSDINVPFVLRYNSSSKKLELISKTVMRKLNFKTTDKKLTV